MATEWQIAANRRNARKSTGPRSYEGRLRARMNARKHGLAGDLMQDPTLAKAVTALAIQLGGRKAPPARRRVALTAAEATVSLMRTGAARREVLAQLAAAVTREREEEVSDLLRQLERIERYERRAFSRRSTALRQLITEVRQRGKPNLAKQTQFEVD
jgi:hypothetical protein